jgi:hypothetical protein
MGADKSLLAFHISYFQHNKINFLGWVKEVRTAKVISVWSSGGEYVE